MDFWGGWAFLFLPFSQTDAMYSSASKYDSELRPKLKWLIISRLAFSTLLFGSTVVLHLSKSQDTASGALVILYGIISAIYILSVVYAVLLRTLKRVEVQAYVQTSIDTLIVSLIVFLTGSYASIFVFLYPRVIIYTSMLVYRYGSFLMAAVCGVEYSVLVCFEYTGFLSPMALSEVKAASHYPLDSVIYRVLITVGACFAVAFLSSILSEQARKTRQELRAMEEQIRRVEKMAAVGEMGAGLAHEIKNPLASITGAIQLLRDEMNYDPGIDKLMQIILREADRLSTLVSNFLLFARPPSGRREPLQLDAAIPDTIALFEKNKKCREHIRINYGGDSNLWLEMDPDHFRQILWNLLVNAAEAISGEGTIDIHQSRGRDHQVRIRISDSGCGMESEIQRTVFDPFFTTKASGTGLGLSIVHRIVEFYGGQLELDSEPGKGTDFVIKLRGITGPDGLDTRR
jgi:two-component system sensor histidine kinase PilS (NtrC family)